MSGISGIYLVFALVCFAFSVAVAQDSSSSTTAAAESSTTPATPNYPVSCQDAVPLTISATWIFGTWYEAAGKPIGGGNNTKDCVELAFAYRNGSLLATITYNSDPTQLWINQTIVRNLSNSDGMIGFFPAEWNTSIDGVTTTYKLLATDYNTYTLICGYVKDIESTTTTSSASTSDSTPTSSTGSTVASSTTAASTRTSNPAGAFILTREREITTTHLASLTSAAVVEFKDFEGIDPIIQSEECTGDGASSTLPALTMILVVVYSFLKFVH